MYTCMYTGSRKGNSRISDGDSFSPLHAAVIGRSLETLRVLLERGTSSSSRNRIVVRGGTGRISSSGGSRSRGI